jgi:ribokinase
MIGKEGNNYLSVAPGENYKLSPEKIHKAMPVIDEAAMIIMQNEIPEETIKYVFYIAKEKMIPVLWNFAPARTFDLSYVGKASILVVNEIEAGFLSGCPVKNDEEVEATACKLHQMGAKLVIITLGKHGSFALSSNEKINVPAFKVEEVDTTSAGDVFCGSFAVARVEGKNLKDSLMFSTAASALCVTKIGAQPSAPNRVEIEKFLANNSQSRGIY